MNCKKNMCHLMNNNVMQSYFKCTYQHKLEYLLQQKRKKNNNNNSGIGIKIQINIDSVFQFRFSL